MMPSSFFVASPPSILPTMAPLITTSPAKRRRNKPGASAVAAPSSSSACCAIVDDQPSKKSFGTSASSSSPSYSYPFCLSVRFLVLAALVTCWVGFFRNVPSQGHHPCDGYVLDESVYDKEAARGAVRRRKGRQDAKVAHVDGTDFPVAKVVGEGYHQDTAVESSKASNGRAQNYNNGGDDEGQPSSTRMETAAEAPAATAVAAATNDDDDDESNEEDDDEIDLDTMLFVENRILIAPGELPGYTGWARPELTLAGHFQIIGVSDMKGTVHQEWSVDVECTHEQCRHGGSLFYLRAYGPSIISGKMEDNGDGTYRAVFYPTDPGRYTIEVVLEFSQKPEYELFPVGANDTELPYEGWLLPGFPMQITIEEEERDEEDGGSEGNKEKSVTTTDQRPWCHLDQLLEADTDSGRTKGRWKVVDNVRTKYHRQITPDGNGVSYLGYQHGLNSLGVKMRYDNNDCRVLTYARANRDADGIHLVNRCLSHLGIANSPQPEDQIHVIFVGCSVMRLMRSSFDFLLRKANMTNVRTSLVDIRRGLFRTLPHMKSQLRNFTQTFPNERKFVVFNTGLHDIDRLCSARMWPARERDQELMNKTIPDGEPCIDTYQKQFEEMVKFIGDYPAELKLFRSTTPGWMKYGNFGFSWPTDFTQPFQRSHHMVTQINDIAFDVLANADNADDILIMDGFWTSLARPDNTEMGPRNQIGKHMVHPGVEVMDALARKFMHIMVRSTCSEALDS